MMAVWSGSETKAILHYVSLHYITVKGEGVVFVGKWGFHMLRWVVLGQLVVIEALV